ncbi:MAG TPA: hypothetical protein VGM65_07475 [Candidatus Udaeobacter sp.]|jgi:hypothetical protein
MKQSEPANPRNLRAERYSDGIQGSATAAEISGYTDIGMKKEALRLTRTVLEKRRILPEEFSEAMRAICIYASAATLKKWKAKVEAAYNRQTRKFRHKVRSDMLSMYVSLNESKTALQFVSIRQSASASDFLFSMDVLLELGRVEDATELSMRFGKALRLARTEFEQSLLSCALGHFFAYTHQWEYALAVWQATPPPSAIASNVLTGIVEIHLARAFEAIEAGIRFLTERKQQQKVETDLCVPGLDFGLAVDAEKELLKLKRGINKLLPNEARKELGILTENDQRGAK